MVSVRYDVQPDLDAWVLHEGNVPESVPHDAAAQRLRLILSAWAEQSERDLTIVRNLAMRWLEHAPRVGIDPDVAVLEPAPPNADELSSLRTWVPGHAPPRLCFEIVSASHPHKDYVAVQDRYAALGAFELCVFDPLLVGPRALGGPVPLQLWRRRADGVFERLHAGASPVFSQVLGAWLIADGRLLQISKDESGSLLWPTGAERERAEKERERAEKERERAEKERERAARLELEERLAELTRKLEPGA